MVTVMKILLINILVHTAKWEQPSHIISFQRSFQFGHINLIFKFLFLRYKISSTLCKCRQRHYGTLTLAWCIAHQLAASYMYVQEHFDKA